MPIFHLCKTISTSLNDRLIRAGSSNERYTIATEALNTAAEHVFPRLAQLRPFDGHDDEYQRAQDAVLQLLSFICIPLVRNCTVPSSAIALLNEKAQSCKDPLARKKLISYGNQIRSMRHKIEAEVKANTSRAAKRPQWQVAENTLLPMVGLLLLIAILAVRTGVHLPPAITPSGMSLPQHRPPQPVPRNDVDNPPAPPDSAPDAAVATSAGPGDFCRYTDDSGVIHLVDDPAKVPERYRSRMTVVAVNRSAGSTKVICRGNRVLVPVTLRYQGRESQALLTLDTGASITTINVDVAARLGIDLATATAETSIVADGRRVQSYHVAAEAVSVGDRTLPGAALSILPGCGNNGSEGLLGMNFLKEFRYHVDYKRGVIEWGR